MRHFWTVAILAACVPQILATVVILLRLASSTILEFLLLYYIVCLLGAIVGCGISVAKKDGMAVHWVLLFLLQALVQPMFCAGMLRLTVFN
jgi:hypothetical protein